MPTDLHITAALLAPGQGHLLMAGFWALFAAFFAVVTVKKIIDLRREQQPYRKRPRRSEAGTPPPSSEHRAPLVPPADAPPVPGAGATPCVACGRPSLAACVSCGRGACEAGDLQHLYSLFLTKRYGTEGDNIGSKFYYLCDAASAPVCVDCLGLRDGYPFPPEEVERHPFTCPHCGGRASAFRVDRAHGWDAAAEMLRTVRALQEDAAPETVPYDGHDRFREVTPGRLVFSDFGPRARALRPGEAWETAVRLVRAGGEDALVVLQRREQPEPGTAFYLDRADGWVRLHAPAREDEVWGSDALAPLLGEGWEERVATISLAEDGAYVANEGGAWSVFVEKRGIRPALPEGGAPPAGGLPRASEAGPREMGPGAYERESELRVHRENIEYDLERVTEMRIWDYAWLESPRPGGFGPHAAVALMASTNLTYYQLLRIRFVGARYSTVPSSFSHPAFTLASAAEEAQLRRLAEFGPRSVAVRVETDFGGSFGLTAYVVCDDVEVEVPPEGESSLKAPYEPVIPENCDWWWADE